MWAVIAIIALVVDLLTSTFLFVSFSAGAVCALIAQSMKASMFLQLIIFIVSSGICVVFVCMQARKLLSKTVKKLPTPEDLLVGRKIVLEEDVTDTATIKIDGLYRTVKNIGAPLKKGDTAVIESIDGTILIIKKGE